MARIFGISAMVLALAGFALFLSTVHATYGISSVALVVGLGALLLMIPMEGRRHAARGGAVVRDPSTGVLNRAARVWTLVAVFAGLGLGIFTLRYMYLL